MITSKQDFIRIAQEKIDTHTDIEELRDLTTKLVTLLGIQDEMIEANDKVVTQLNNLIDMQNTMITKMIDLCETYDVPIPDSTRNIAKMIADRPQQPQH